MIPNLPTEFPINPYGYIYSHILSNSQKSPIPRSSMEPSPLGNFILAWQTVAHRFRLCAEHSQLFSESVYRTGHATTSTEIQLSNEEYYIQERELFGFFIAGFAVIESFCYALYMLGAFVRPTDFPIEARNLRSITPENICEKFKSHFSNEQITRELIHLMNTQEYKDWKDVRNVLAHRIMPGIISGTIVGKNSTKESELWEAGLSNALILNENTTTSKLLWLTQILNSLLVATESFSRTHLP